jgi:glycosyltransferase involved in cell wall biosynthesis
VKLAVYTDYAYAGSRDGLTAERSFALFLREVSAQLEGLLLIGRLRPSGEPLRYPVGSGDQFVALPFYSSLAQPWRVLKVTASSIRIFSGATRDADAVWLFGPHPLSVAFAALALLRRQRVILGVRQDLPAYMRTRHPRRWDLRAAGVALEAAFRLLARWCDVVAVGPDLARRYRRAHRVIDISVSLIGEGEITDPDELERSHGGDLVVLSVGRLEAEKNPLLLADVLRDLEQEEPGVWRMWVCGQGPMENELAARFEELGLGERVDMLGYVPFHEGLLDLYRSSHAFLHVSWTEGFPQVLLEAFAAALPAVATDVGGIAAAVGGAAVLVPPGDARAAGDALREIQRDPELRARLIKAGNAYVRERTIGTEAARVIRFLTLGAAGGSEC